MALGILLATALAGVALLASGLLFGSDPATGPLDGSAATAAAEAGPYDLAQAAPGFDLGRVVQAKFLSLTFSTSDGVRSMMLTRDRPEFEEISAAVSGAEKLSGEVPEPGAGESVTLTFVTEEREAASLILGEDDLFYWQGATYRAAANLQQMVQQAGRLLE